MPEDSVLLSVSNLNVRFDHHVILKDISFKVGFDDSVAVIGPNGAGKTVLFRAILGLVPYEGKVEWAPNVKIGYVPQKLFVAKDIPLAVVEFLGFKEKDPKKIYSILEEVGFGEKGSQDVHQGNRLLKTKLGVLSGGELQRVAIAFALLGEPQVLLFDEPTSGIDISGEETVYSLITRLQKEKRLTVIFISHELTIVYKHANNVLCLNKEKISIGPPRKVIDKKTLEKLYGEEVHLHKHN